MYVIQSRGLPASPALHVPAGPTRIQCWLRHRIRRINRSIMTPWMVIDLNQVSLALQNATHSLILLDELGNGALPSGY